MKKQSLKSAYQAYQQSHACDIVDCEHDRVAIVNGICVCERCRLDFVSIGFGAVRFDGRWHGVRGATYTAHQADIFPGLLVERSALAEGEAS